MSEKANYPQKNVKNNRKINYVDIEDSFDNEEEFEEAYIGQRGRPPKKSPLHTIRIEK